MIKRPTNDLSFETIEVPAEEGAFDDLLDFIADLMVRKWMEDQEMLKIEKQAEIR